MSSKFSVETPSRPRSSSFRDSSPFQESPVEINKPSVGITDAPENLRGHAQWEKHMKGVNLQRRYRKVSVIMIHWEEDGEDKDAVKAQQEVDRLTQTFRDTYRFTVRERKLKAGSKSPQVQIHHYLAEFVYEEDDENTLMIIYYAGHGTPEYVTNRLLMARGNLDEKSNQMDHIVWEEAERLIHGAQRADIFLILDCCHAGRLIRTREGAQWSDRIFEFLGAAGAAQTTPMPGPKSFTTALIWALEALAKDRDRFTSSELLSKILDAPEFGFDGQLPCLAERTLHCVRRLVLEPLALEVDTPTSPDRDQSNERVDSSQYCLGLQFLLSKAPADDDYKKLCDGLREIITSPDSVTQQIIWRGLYPKEHISQMPHYARIAGLHWQNHALKEKVRKLSMGGNLGTGSPNAKRDGIKQYGQLTPAPSEGFAESVNGDLHDDHREIPVQTEPPAVSPHDDSALSKQDTKLIGRTAVLAAITAICIQRVRSQGLEILVVLALLVYYVL